MFAQAGVSVVNGITRLVFMRKRCDGCGGEFGPLPVRLHAGSEEGSFCSGACARRF